MIAAGVGASALILITTLAGITPSWPNGIVQLTAIFQLTILAIVFQTMEHSSKSTITKFMKKTMIIGLLSLITYLLIYSIFHYTLPEGKIAVRGMFCTNDALIRYDSCPLLTTTEIADAQYDQEKLWTVLGIGISRVLVMVLWICFFSSLVSFLGSFAAYRNRKEIL